MIKKDFRSLARILAFQFLYQFQFDTLKEEHQKILAELDQGNNRPLRKNFQDALLDATLKDREENFADNLADKAQDLAMVLVEGALKNDSQITDAIRDASKNWKVSRIAKVDLAILKQSLFEMLFFLKTPRPVVINEAIELAKEFGTIDSPRFINGILDEISKKHPPLPA